MDPEMRQMILETAELSRENNKMLKSMRAANRRSQLFAFLKLAVGLVLAYFAYIYLAPYLKDLSAVLTSIKGGVSGLKNLSF